MNSFDRKFGTNLLSTAPTCPGVYLFWDDAEVIYVGKAKNVRRRLSNYRNASRRKVHRKMRRIVREASSIEIRVQVDERSALLAENELIRKLTPRFNIDGAYSFLYPSIGLKLSDETLMLCMTTDIAGWAAHTFTWFGAFRSRTRTKVAFAAIEELLSIAAHRERSLPLDIQPLRRGDRIIGFRRSGNLTETLSDYFAGESQVALGHIASILVERHRARREAAQVQLHLNNLRYFYEHDLRPLNEALISAGVSYISQEHRDALFLAHR